MCWIVGAMAYIGLIIGIVRMAEEHERDQAVRKAERMAERERVQWIRDYGTVEQNLLLDMYLQQQNTQGVIGLVGLLLLTK